VLRKLSATRSISMQHAARSISMQHATRNINAACFLRRLRNKQRAHASLSRMHRYAHRTATPSDDAVA
jgi:hypothetical protein